MKSNLAFITEATFGRIYKNKDLKENQWRWNLYLYKGNILSFLSYWYLRFLNKYSIFLEKLTNSEVDFFEVIWKTDDTYTKIYEWWQPTFHLYKDCTRLHSNYVNYEIPLNIQTKFSHRCEKWFDDNKYLLNNNESYSEFKELLLKEYNINLEKLSFNEIKEKWINNLKNRIVETWKHQNIKIFREWFKENQFLIENNEKEFTKKFNEKWWLPNEFKEPDIYDNSWITSLENLTFEELEEKLENEISIITDYIEWLNTKEKIIINVLWKQFFRLKWLDEEYFWKEVWKIHKVNIENFYKDYSFSDLYDFLKNFDESYVYKLLPILKKYINIKINPNFDFTTSFLENLGLKCCNECEKRKNNKN